MPKRNTFSREFKLEAIRLLETGDKKATDLARELGVPRNKLYKWREELNAKDNEIRDRFIFNQRSEFSRIAPRFIRGPGSTDRESQTT